MTAKRSYKKLIIWFWGIIVSGILGAFIFFYGIANWELLGPLPSIEELENPETHQATEIYSIDKKVIGTFFAENRSNVSYDEISPYIINGLIATEDERFKEHSGIDARALGRAIAGAAMGQNKGGGSTITQQLAKMLFKKGSRSPIERIKEKFQEWVIALQLEQRYTKEEIITLYLNKFDFINNAAGIKSACRVYFNTSPQDIKIEEAATLVGMAKNPALFNPNRESRLDTTTHRRNVVLFQMKRNNFITQEEYDSLTALPLELDFQKATHTAGIGTYFREVLRKDLNKYLDGIVKSDGTPYNIYKDGLKIYTTIDSRMQKYAEWAVKEHLRTDLQKSFFKHWEGRKNAPYYFEDLTLDQVNEQVKDIMERGMRQSGRYNMAQERYPSIVKPKRKYDRVKTQQNRYKNRVDQFERERESIQIELNRLAKDTTGRAVVYRTREELDDRRDEVKDSIEYFQELAEDLQPEVDELWDEYYKYWKPFDDSMKQVFREPVEMSVFSWEGSIDTVMSPLDSVRYHKWFLRAGMLSVEPKNGHIKAWVGGADYKHFKFDQVRQGKRQVGSTFKPFVYAAGIENGVSPCEEVLNIPICIPAGKWGLIQDWCPENSSAKELEGKRLTMKLALANSVNSVSAYHMNQYGPHEVIRIARKFGLKGHIDPVPSIALGTCDVNLYEMVGAYAAFANKGTWNEPTYLLRIEDKFGNVIYQHQTDVKDAMSEENAYKMLELLSGVSAYGKKIDGKSTYGTGIRLRFASRPYGGIPFSRVIAGKTGTTQNQSDGWFMGITNDLVTGVWVGAEDRAAHFRSVSLGSGTNMALPMWGYYMNKVWADEDLKYEAKEFEKPESLKDVNFDCDQYQNSIFDAGSDNSDPFNN